MSEKVEGSPCKNCGGTIRYKSVSNRAKEGKCVHCSGIASERSERKSAAAYKASEGINTPYRACYMNGYKAQKETKCPHPATEIGKRCAWLAGYNDKWMES